MPAYGQSAPDRKTAFVLAGGGSFGAIQVGMLQALADAGITADFVVGSSVGAINGAYYAGNPDRVGVAQLASLWRALRRQTVFPITLRTAIGFLWRRDFLVSSDGLRRLISDNLPYKNLEDAKIPIHIVTTDVLSGQSVVLSRGPAADAIIASSAIPAAFAPVALGGQFLVDGAITSNTPVKVAVACGAQRLIVLPTGFSCALASPPKGALASGLHALTLLIARQLVGELENLSPYIDYAIVPPLCPLKGSPYDFSQTNALIERAAHSTRAWLEDDGLNLKAIPNMMRAHHH